MENMKLLKSGTFIFVLIGTLLSFPGVAQEQGLSVIGHPASIPDALKMQQLKSILLGEKLKWDDGVSVKIALMKTGTPIGIQTCEKVYEMSPNELNKHFLALVFQGKAKAPTFFNSISELEEYIAQTPGAIGISQVPSTSTVKTVQVDGNKVIQ